MCVWAFSWSRSSTAPLTCIFRLHGKWKIEQNILKDFFVSRSAPEQSEAIYPNLEKRINESLNQPSSAVLTSSSLDQLISDSPQPPGSPSPNLSNLPLGLPSAPSGLPPPEHATAVIRCLTLWYLDNSHSLFAEPGSHCRSQHPRPPFCLWTDSSTHLSQSHIKMGVPRYLDGMSSQWWGHLCLWSWRVCWQKYSFWAPVTPVVCTTHLELTLLLWWTDSTVTSHDPPLVLFMPLYDPLSLSVSRTCDLLLINGIWHRGWAVPSQTVLHGWDASLLTRSLLKLPLLDWWRG